MTDFTRVTVTGTTRRAEVVLPSDEPIGTTLPSLLELLGEPSGTVARPLALVRPDGDWLDLGLSAAQLDLLDGTALRLVQLDAAPPPPAVVDLTDAAADAHAARHDRWDSRARLAVAGTAVALAAAVGGAVVPYGDTATAAVVLPCASVLLTLLALGTGLVGARAVSGLLTTAAAGLAVPAGAAVLALAERTTDAGTALLAAAGTILALASVSAAIGAGLARRRPGPAAGGVIGTALAVLLLVLLACGVAAESAAAVTAVVATFTTGVLPWVALGSAGLTGLDQRVAEGERLARGQALGRVDEAYAALTWSVAAVAATAAVCAVTLVLSAELWGGLLAAATALAAALRTRAFPLRGQAALLWTVPAAAGVAAGATLLSGERGWLGLAVCAAVAVLVAAAALVRPRPHVRARLRGLGNVAELVTIVALLPLLLGSFGVYGELLGMFGGTA